PGFRPAKFSGTSMVRESWPAASLSATPQHLRARKSSSLRRPLRAHKGGSSERLRAGTRSRQACLDGFALTFMGKIIPDLFENFDLVFFVSGLLPGVAGQLLRVQPKIFLVR